MAYHVNFYETHHFKSQRARRSIRCDVALVVAREGDAHDGVVHRISPRHATQCAAELYAEARLLKQSVHYLSLAANSNYSEDAHLAFSFVREVLLARAAELRHEADKVHAARGVTTVVCGNALVTTYRHAV